MLKFQRRAGVTTLLLLALCTWIPQLSAVEAAPEAAALTPREVVGWMAPMRIENGRLSVDWGAVGLIAARHAGVSDTGDRAHSTIDKDVKFLVRATTGGTADTPQFELTLHASGGSPQNLSADDAARDMPISVGISENQPRAACAENSPFTAALARMANLTTHPR